MILGGIEFLVIILVGEIVNTINTMLLTSEKTKSICYFTYLLSNTVTITATNI